MTFQYSENVQNILNAWIEGVRKLVNDGKVSPQLAENVENLISDGKINDIDGIRLAIESGVKNVETN